MKERIIVGTLIAVLLGIMLPISVQSDDTTRIVIGFDSAGSKASIVRTVQDHRGTLIKEIPTINALVFAVPGRAFDKLSSNSELQKHIRYIEKDGIANIQVTTEFTPNDPGFSYQWGYPMIDAPNGWDFFGTGDPSIIVAVVDTGTDYNHVDLDANVDPSLGYDFVNDDPDPMDDNGHGTHVAGTIAAETDNGIGVAGVAGGVTVMPVKVCNWFGSCWYSDIADGIIWSVAHGAKIVSMSLGGYTSSPLLEDATHYAVYDKGALVIAAAGNDNSNSLHYPSAYRWVIGVAALGSDGTKAWYSNYGWENVYVAAPGGDSCGGCSGDILSTWPGNQYKYIAGTSMATPHVSGVAALYWSYNPSLTNRQVGRALLKHADDIGTPGRDVYYGFGRVDAYPPAD